MAVYEDTMQTLLSLRSLVAGGGDDSVFTPAQKGWISKLHKQEFGEPVRECGCKNKYTDAVLLLYSKLRKVGKTEEEKRYTLRAGDIIWLNTDCYTRHNLTDEVAERYLELHPDEAWRFAKPTK